MDPTTILLVALAAAGYFLFVKKDDRPGGRHPGHGGGGPRGPRGPRTAPDGTGLPPGAQDPGGPRPPSGAGPLLDQLNSMIAQAMAISDTDDAVSALKVAGQFGVSQVGPAVDRQTHNRSKALTTAASHDNGMLQAITTSMAGWMWATTILFPGALLLQIPTALATSAATSASSNDKMKASGLVHGMYEKYASALDQFGGTAGPAVAGYAPLFATGLSPAICWDAGTNPQWCAAVTTALMNERNPTRLRALAAHVAHAGFPMAANSLLTKADRIAYDPGY